MHETAGQARFPDGKPAAGAHVTVRTGQAVQAGDSMGWRLLAHTLADAEGRFRIAVPESMEVFLEIRSVSEPGLNSSSPSLQARLLRFEAFAPRPKELGVISQSPTRAFKGSIAPLSGKLPSALWLGIPGTAFSVKLTGPATDGALPFHLAGVAHGSEALVVIMPTDKGLAQYKVNGTVNTDAIKLTSGTETDLGRLSCDDLGSFP